MKPWLRWTLGTLIVGGYVACSPKQFSRGGCEDSNSGCIATASGLDYEDVITVDGGKVDVLVVDDNSASMSYEQSQLANRFSGFIQNLDNQSIDYRIAVTTTDISGPGNESRAINGNGALQDGRLIAFPGGSKFLTRNGGGLPQKDSDFKSTVRRPETLACEQFIVNWVNAGKSRTTNEYRDAYHANCPSGDERGIFAARMVIENNPDGFLRPDADLAVIILADEDERSANYRGQNAGETHSYDASFALQDYDKSQGFVDAMAAKYPTKTFGVHPIIVQSGDNACLSTQNGQTLGLVSGSYGTEYEWLRYRSNGTQGSICASDYTAILQNIFDNVQGKIVDKVALKCAMPTNVTVDRISGPSLPAWTVVGSELRFNQKLTKGTTIRVRHSCPGVN